MPVAASVVQISISPGGVPKLPIPQVRVTRLGLEGDDHHDVNHGGSDRAVCIYSAERIAALAAEGHPIAPGTTGENLTIAGLAWETLRPGTRLRVGDEVVLQVTAFTTPCQTIARSFQDERFVRISERLHPGWSRLYCRVLHEGLIATGDLVELL